MSTISANICSIKFLRNAKKVALQSDRLIKCVLLYYTAYLRNGCIIFDRPEHKPGKKKKAACLFRASGGYELLCGNVLFIG